MSSVTQTQEHNLDIPHVMVVDDDDRICALLHRYLTEQGFAVTTACDAADAREKLKYFLYDLLIVDVMMPGEDGLSLTRGLKTDMPHVPVLLLTALGEVDDRISGLEAGADDYLPKPFEPKELLLRVNAILRRVDRPSGGKSGGDISLGDWVFSVERGDLTHQADGHHMSLTTVEQDLLRILVKRQGQVVERDELATLNGSDPNTRTIDVQVTRLRKKIEADPKRPRYLQTVRGRGYILRPDTV